MFENISNLSSKIFICILYENWIQKKKVEFVVGMVCLLSIQITYRVKLEPYSEFLIERNFRSLWIQSAEALHRLAECVPDL
jgi:hypothetical protein